MNNGPSGGVLLTGHKGFIGSHLLEAIRAKGWPVRPWEEPLAGLGAAKAPAETVVHLAAATRARLFAHKPVESWLGNVADTESVLNYCEKQGAHLVFASSSAVYGRPDAERNIPEESSLAPVTPYGFSKLLAEELCRRRARDRGVPVTCLRIFSPYGPGLPEDFFLGYVVRNILTGQPVQVRDPWIERDFIHVSDVVRGIIAAVERGPRDFSAMNLGTGQAASLWEALELAQEIFERAVKAEAGADSGKRERLVADVTKARLALGWTPRLGLREGLLAWKKRLENPEPASGPAIG